MEGITVLNFWTMSKNKHCPNTWGDTDSLQHPFYNVTHKPKNKPQQHTCPDLRVSSCSQENGKYILKQVNKYIINSVSILSQLTPEISASLYQAWLPVIAATSVSELLQVVSLHDYKRFPEVYPQENTHGVHLHFVTNRVKLWYSR